MKFLFILFALINVYYVVGTTTPFIKNGQRAEIFELTDNEVSVIKVTMPDNEFDMLKLKAKSNKNVYGSGNNESSFPIFFQNLYIDLSDLLDTTKYYLELLKKYNIVKLYPDFKTDEFPELKISDKGYCNYNIEKVLGGFKFNDEFYDEELKNEYKFVDLKLKVLRSNKYFRLLDILATLASLTTYNNISVDSTLVERLSYFNFVKKDEDGNYYFDSENYLSFIDTYEDRDYEAPEDLKDINNAKIDERKNKLYKYLENISKNLKREIRLLKKYNFKELYPDFNVEEKLPELKINDDGFSDISIDTLIKGFDINFENYDESDIAFDYSELNIMVHQSNKNFDLLKVLTTLAKFTSFHNSKSDNEFIRRLFYYKFVSTNGSNKYIFNKNGYNSESKSYYNINEEKENYSSSSSSIAKIPTENLDDEEYNDHIYELSYDLKEIMDHIIYILSELKRNNLIKLFPKLDFEKELPELKVNKEGFSEIDIDDIINGYSINTDDYPEVDIDYEFKDLEQYFYLSNQDFNIVKVSIKLADYANFTCAMNDSRILGYLVPFKYCSIDNDGRSYSCDKEAYNEFKFFYQRANNSYLNEDERNGILLGIFNSYFTEIRNAIALLKKFNLKELFPTTDFDTKFPELKVNKNGYSSIDIDETLNGFEFNARDYIYYCRQGNIEDSFISKLITFQSHPKFNLLKILVSLANEATFDNSVFDNLLFHELVLYKFVTIHDDGTFSFDKSYYDYNFIYYNRYYENVPYLKSSYEELHHQFILTVRTIGYTLMNLKENNLNELFPNINFSKELPELEVDDYGYSQINVDEILSHFVYNKEDYFALKEDELDCESGKFKIIVYRSNTSFDYFHILKYLSDRTAFEGSWKDNDFIFELAFFKFVYLKEDGLYSHRTTDENKLLFPSYSFYDAIIEEDDDDDKDFKTKNATIIAEIKGNKKTFNKVTFSISGRFSRMFSKPQYKFKIRGNDDLFGRTQFKLRSDTVEPTLLRDKLVADIHNRLGVPSISANYVTLYINEEYMGLYILMDSYKLSWIEYEFGEKDTTSLYKCEASKLTSEKSYCKNENEDVDEYNEWDTFIQSLDQANSVEEIEKILDVDQFLTEMAIDFLTGGWDHFRADHNYFMYKQKNGKWLYLSYDFDLDLSGNQMYPIYRFSDFINDVHLIDILINDNTERFDKIVQDIIAKVFNPALLFPHIDELKDLIRPYVKKEKEMDEDGHYPGRINESGWDFYSYSVWDANSEFTTVSSTWDYSFGLKYWILGRYRFLCTYYSMDCDPVYMDENYKYSIDEEVEYQGNIRKSEFAIDYEKKFKYIKEEEEEEENTMSNNSFFEIPTDFIENDDFDTALGEQDGPTTLFEDDQQTTTFTNKKTITKTKTSTQPTNTSPASKVTTTTSQSEHHTTINKTSVNIPTITTTTTISTKSTTVQKTTSTIIATPTNAANGNNQESKPFKNQYKCWSELLGSPCCPPKVTIVYSHDEYGDWGYDFKRKEWCGLTPFEENETEEEEEECWSEKLGYTCCQGCKVYEKDSDGSWGYELNQWCGIPSKCHS
ncbi:coth-domain-containing protein [Piromyces finnis]|uniref:Coth-domain-containing protein n=1 Tax=Piromyces finnis TaxID=1754191 RepID=A0A1Y1V739_9FUNG|nr:coth-domain-containing protein [Piromyces finnis]|eukprot:ORX48665.1 coth-domain-containing protein [Piromyces finnis]